MKLYPTQIGVLSAFIVMAIKRYPPEQMEGELKKMVDAYDGLPSYKKLRKYNWDILDTLIAYFKEEEWSRLSKVSRGDSDE